MFIYSYSYCPYDYRFAIIKRGEIVGLLKTLVFIKVHIIPHELSKSVKLFKMAT